MFIEEASRKVFDDNMARFERDSMKALTDPQDREALAELVGEWRRLGDHTLRKLSMNQLWNMPLYFALSAAILNRRMINELKKGVKSQ